MREQPPKLSASDLDAICDYVHELGHLKTVQRSGWKLAGITDVESVAEHTFRTAIIGMLLAMLEGADPARTALMCLLHDVPEIRIGDIPSVGKKYLAIRDDVDVAGDQVRNLPPPLARLIHEISLEYRARESHEARLAKDADRVECLTQALEYVAAGHTGAGSWIESTAETIESPSARSLGHALRERDPTAWWRRFVERYRGRGSDVMDV